MDCNSFTKEQLLERIEELEILCGELLKEKEQEAKLDYAWTGNLGHWYWNIKTNTVTFNLMKATALGYDKSELPEPVPYQFFTDKLHPDDYQNTMDAMLKHLYGKAPVYEVEYRIQAKDGSYKWYYDRGKITRYDKQGKPLFLAGIVFDITKRKEQQMELECKNRFLAEMSSIDGLTKLRNHRTLMDQLKVEIAIAKMNGGPLSIVFFDVDDFKKINDTKGHVVGDQVLIEIASLIKKNIRETDMAGRYGGEEFLIILPNTNLETAVNAAERIRQAIFSFSFVDDLKITISGGVSEYHGEGLTELIHSADKKLYTAKKNGKNQIAYITDG